MSAMPKPVALLVLPIHSDPDHKDRLDAIGRAVGRSGWNLLIPEYEKTTSHFEEAAARENLRRSALVIADLSYERPSCYFEVGFAQALGKKVHMFALQGTPVHQVSDRGKVKFYGSLEELERMLEGLLSDSTSDAA